MCRTRDMARRSAAWPASATAPQKPSASERLAAQTPTVGKPDYEALRHRIATGATRIEVVAFTSDHLSESCGSTSAPAAASGSATTSPVAGGSCC